MYFLQQLMAPQAQIQAQIGVDEEYIDIDQALSSDINSDSDNGPITHPDPSQSCSSNPSHLATGGAVGQVWQLIVLNLISLC